MEQNIGSNYCVRVLTFDALNKAIGEGMEHPLYLRTFPMPSMPTSQQEGIEEFWRMRQEEIEKTMNFHEHAIPMARVKSIICCEKGNIMMTFDMPAFLSKLCELFVQELTIRAWMSAQFHGCCIILDSDIAKAITTTKSYDFLLDILHSHQVKHKKSIHQPWSTRKHCKTIHRTSHPLNHIPPSMPMISQYMPFSFSFLPKEAPLTMPVPIVNRIMTPQNGMFGDAYSFGNDINKINGNAQTNTNDGNNSIVETANDSVLGIFLEEFNADGYSFFPDAASTTDIPFDIATMYDGEGLNNDPYIVNAVISNPSTNSGGNQMN